MQYPGNATIRKKLSDYLDRAINLCQFYEWLMRNCAINETTPASTRDLVYEIKLRIAEYTSGDWTEPSLRLVLIPIATSFDTAFFSTDAMHVAEARFIPSVESHFLKSSSNSRSVAVSLQSLCPRS